MLGAALNHSALNIANGLGAWLGAVVIAAGHGYRASSLVGVAPRGRRAGDLRARASPPSAAPSGPDRLDAGLRTQPHLVALVQSERRRLGAGHDDLDGVGVQRRRG